MSLISFIILSLLDPYPTNRDEGIKKSQAFFMGNVTSHRQHITRYLLSFVLIRCVELMLRRTHYSEYLIFCESKNIVPKAYPPKGWKAEKCVDSFHFSTEITSNKICAQDSENDGWLSCPDHEKNSACHEGWFEGIHFRTYR